MIPYFRIKVLTTTLLSFFFLNLISQNEKPYLDPKFGPDSTSRVQCANDLSTLAEYMKIDLPQYAIPAWRRLFTNCPESRKNIYISGAKIFQDLLDKETDESIKAGLYDTLMMIYDMRIEYFGDEGYVLGRKGIDIIKYNPSDFPDAYAAFDRSTELSGDETDLNVLTGLIQTASAMNKMDLISTEEFLDKFMTSRRIYANLISEKKSIPKVKRTQSITDKIVLNSGIKDCEGLEKFFSGQFEGNDNDPEMLNVALELMTTAGCTNTPFYAATNERLLKVKPDPSVAYEVAKFNLQNENFPKAVEFLKLAIEYENKPDQKALYYHQVALINLSKLSNPPEARKYALLAIENNPAWGGTYFIAAASVIEGIQKCDVEKFEKQAVYWLAVDYCAKAKSVDPSSASKADDLIQQYKTGFPNVEEIFFRSLKEGDSYKINCWINETTKVKSR